MPELPEVETIVRELRPAIIGRTIDRVHVHRADVIHGAHGPLPRLLQGRTVRALTRRAKRINFDIAPDIILVIHLGMSGRLTLQDAGAPREKHTHLRVSLSGTTSEVRFRDPRRFGGVWYMKNGATEHYGLGPLGPEPLDLSLRGFLPILQRRRSIKPLLMDQRLIAGLGNIYCDESLHYAGMHPLRPADEISRDQCKRLLRSIKSTLRKAIAHNGSTFVDYRRANGDPGAFQRLHRVYQREGQTCKTCRAADIERIVVIGRSTFLCPVCQSEPRS